MEQHLDKIKRNKTTKTTNLCREMAKLSVKIPEKSEENPKLVEKSENEEKKSKKKNTQKKRKNQRPVRI